MHGKTIEMFLVDGSAEGIVTAELSNWNGKAVKLPRSAVHECDREDVQGVGIYFLFCAEDGDTNSVYIGEAENVLKRLRQHLQDFRRGTESYYWNAAVAFLGGDLNKASIRYLEDRLVEIAKDCGHDDVLTKATYKTHLKESQVASMEEFIDNVKVLLSALGFRTLAPAPKATEATQYLFCKGSGASGKGFVSPGGFTVLSGTKVSDHVVDSFRKHGSAYSRLREKLLQDGTIIDDAFVRDYEFSAPSAASSVVLGRSSNGNIDWKNSDGVCLRDLQ